MKLILISCSSEALIVIALLCAVIFCCLFICYREYKLTTHEHDEMYSDWLFYPYSNPYRNKPKK